MSVQITTGYVAAGCKVYIASRDKKALDETAKELNAQGPGECIALPCDLSKYDAIEQLVAELSKREKSRRFLRSMDTRIVY